MFVKNVLDGVNEGLLGALCAKRCAQGFEEEGRCVRVACDCGLEVEQLVA